MKFPVKWTWKCKNRRAGQNKFQQTRLESQKLITQVYPQQKHLQSRDQQLCKPGSVHWDWTQLAKETWINMEGEDTTGRFAPAQALLPWAVTSTCRDTGCSCSTSTKDVKRHPASGLAFGKAAASKGFHIRSKTTPKCSFAMYSFQF